MREHQDELKGDMYVGFTTKHSKNKEEVRFTFRRASYARIACAMRLYFEMIYGDPYVFPESKNTRGFAISGKTPQLRCSHPGVVRWFKEHGGGEYNFKFDYRYNAYGFEKVENDEPENKEDLNSKLAFEEGDKNERFDMVISLTPNQGQVLEVLAKYTGRTTEDIARKFIADKINGIADEINNTKGCLKGE